MRYLAHSRRFLIDYNLPDASLVGRNHYDVFPDTPAHWKKIHARCLGGATESYPEERFERADGSVQWVRWEMVPWLDDLGAIGGVVLFTENITELKHAYQRIADQERLLAEIIDGSPSLIFAFDREGRITVANQAATEFLGTTKEALLHTLPGESVSKEQQAEYYRRHVNVMTTGMPQAAEVTVQVQGVSRHVIATRYPLRDVAGNIYGTASITTDITRQKQIEAELRQSEERTREALAELEKALEVTRRAEEKLRHAQKMEAVGRLAGGIAHDFNNLLTVILGNSSEVLTELTPGEPFHDALTEIEKAAHRAAGLTRQLLAFSRKQVLDPHCVNINELIQGAEKMLRRILGEDIELTFLLDPQPQLCTVDSGQFEQVLLNLVVNARDAMVDGGRLTIETTTVMLDASYVAEHPDARVGEHVRLTVSDTGVGIPKHLQMHVFEPFFTTKSPGRGTGLGLSTVYGIIRQSGGTIWVYSEVDQGTTFKIYLPRQSVMIPGVAPVVPPVKTTRGTGTVLVVEDDEQVRNTISLILRRAGYHVITASNGGEALLICEEHGGTIHLLLTDVVMPKLNGRKLAERLRQIRPAMRVLFMSGYTENVVVHHGILDTGLHFLAKPITSDSLLTKVREALDR